METEEHKMFKIVEHWKPIKTIPLPEEILGKDNKLFPLFRCIYELVKREYQRFPRRKNGEDPFIHPVNAAFFLKQARVSDGINYCIALLHDLVEEKVDIYEEKNNLVRDREKMRVLDHYEHEIINELKQKLAVECHRLRQDKEMVDTIIDTIKLLTRNKRHYYYRSISGIFNCKNNEIKERAILVKLADRTHNIMCIESFNEQQRIYQCFKNIFILNNTKKYLIKKLGKEAFLDRNKMTPPEKMFAKCCRATFEAFLYICYLCGRRGLVEITPLLQLAFKKFEFSRHGLHSITSTKTNEAHPLRLYTNIVRKYDARLHHEWKKFNTMMENEREYCRKFFVDFRFSEEQIRFIIDYKDAYALREVIARLLYDADYQLGGFSSEELTIKGRIKR